ncbi:AMP-binding protein [Streptomyces sp. NPDC090022]|uniref:AMP-binding protein n=1 Tax=Streptomyces sp. NPDC090022 TaxID=3365920 RepID=UPI00380B84D0
MTQETESNRSGPRTADTVLARFEWWVRDTPDARAVISGPRSLGYRQLDARANQLAHHLLDAGIPAGATVAVAAAQPLDTLIGLLAVLKAGGAYALVDPEAGRVAHQQLFAVQPFALLTHGAHGARLDDGTGRLVVRLDTDAAAIAARPEQAPAVAREAAGEAAAGATAAVLTGGGAVPHAVPLGHARLLAAYEGWAEVARLTGDDRHLITAPCDGTAFAAGWTRALCSGGTLVLPVRGSWRADEVRRVVAAERVTAVHTDPAGAVRLLAPAPGRPDLRRPDPELGRLRLLTVTGDRLFLDELGELQTRLRPGARVLNVYGTTETAGCGTWFELAQLPRPEEHPERLSLIGLPFPGCRVDLRDGEIHLAPPEGGDALPTGDRGVLRADGLLEYAGRDRDDISLATGRIDAHRVESVIRCHEEVGSVLVRAVPDTKGVGRLVAYLTPPAFPPAGDPGPGLPDTAALRDYLKGKLPHAQIPRGTATLRTLPRTRAGREHRAGLPLPVEPMRARATGGKYAAATGEGEFPTGLGVGCLTLVPAVLAFVLTDFFWPYSTDLTGVPSPWAGFFQILYVIECLSFGAGVFFLVAGRSRMRAQGRSRRLTTAAHLAVVYLLMSWWPQDNFYRLAQKQDWPRQAALVYAFNVPLMIAAAVVAVYLTRKQPDPFGFTRDEDGDTGEGADGKGNGSGNGAVAGGRAGGRSRHGD